MLSFDQALTKILNEVVPPGTELCDLRSAHLRVLAQDLVAQYDVPPFENSSMDGYGLRADDTLNAAPDRPVELALEGEIGAGDAAERALSPGCACRIFTGGAIPRGADTVIEQESVELVDRRIRLRAPVARGRNIRRQGEDISSGHTVLEHGVSISAARMGVIASLGFSRIRVYSTPRVAILTTGSELVDVGGPLGPGKIRDSNSYTLTSLVRESGCTPVGIGRAADSIPVLRGKLIEGLSIDALITSGGVSVGDRDLVLDTLVELGAEIRFWKVNIKPGMPFAFCLFRRQGEAKPVPVFALPGNPVSSMVTFLQLVRPALEKMRGFRRWQSELRLRAILEHDYEKNDGKRHFARGIVRNENGTLLVRKSGSQSSGVLTSMAVANCLMIIPEDITLAKAGVEIEIELFRTPLQA
jgi:molybdopterin molybdotransferase